MKIIAIDNKFLIKEMHRDIDLKRMSMNLWYYLSLADGETYSEEHREMENKLFFHYSGEDIVTVTGADLVLKLFSDIHFLLTHEDIDRVASEELNFPMGSQALVKHLLKFDELKNFDLYSVKEI